MSPRGQRICVGVGCVMVIIHVVVAVLLTQRDFETAPFEFQGTLITTPLYFRIIVSPAWMFGVPLAGALALAAVWLKKPVRSAAYVLPAVVLTITAAGTWFIGQYT